MWGALRFRPWVPAPPPMARTCKGRGKRHVTTVLPHCPGAHKRPQHDVHAARPRAPLAVPTTHPTLTFAPRPKPTTSAKKIAQTKTAGGAAGRQLKHLPLTTTAGGGCAPSHTHPTNAASLLQRSPAGLTPCDFRVHHGWLGPALGEQVQRWGRVGAGGGRGGGGGGGGVRGVAGGWWVLWWLCALAVRPQFAINDWTDVGFRAFTFRPFRGTRWAHALHVVPPTPRACAV